MPRLAFGPECDLAKKYLNNTATWNPRKPNGKLWSGLYSNELASKSISKFATKNRLKNILKAAKGFSVLVYSLCELKGPLLELRWLLNYLYTDRILHTFWCVLGWFIYTYASCKWIMHMSWQTAASSQGLLFSFSFWLFICSSASCCSTPSPEKSWEAFC